MKTLTPNDQIARLRSLYSSGVMLLANCCGNIRAASVGSEIYNATINTLAVDTYGTVVHPDGAETARWLDNPVVFLEHSWRSFGVPIADTLPIGIAKTITPSVDKLDASWVFSTKNPNGVLARGMVDEGALKGTSIGFTPIAYDFVDTQVTREENGQPVVAALTIMHIRKWELLEFSLVGLPSNPDCLVHDKQGARVISYPSQRAEARACAVRVVELLQKGASVDEMREALEPALQSVYGVKRDDLDAGIIASQCLDDMAGIAREMGGKDGALVLSLLDATLKSKLESINNPVN